MAITSSRLARECRLNRRLAERDAAEFPGTIEFYAEALAAYGDPITAAVTLGTVDREHEDGGFVRIRSGTVLLRMSRRDYEALPDLETKPRVRLTRDAYPDHPPEEMRVFEWHDQAPGVWLIRCAEWGR